MRPHALMVLSVGLLMAADDPKEDAIKKEMASSREPGSSSRWKSMARTSPASPSTRWSSRTTSGPFLKATES